MEFMAIDLYRRPIPVGLANTGFLTLPFLAFLWTSMNYYSDLLATQSPNFYNRNNVEEYDFIVGMI